MQIGIIYGGIGIEESHNQKTLKEITAILDYYNLEYQNIYLNKKINSSHIKKCDLFFVIDSNVPNYIKKFKLFKYIYDKNIDLIGQRDEVCRILRDKYYTNFLLRSHGILTPQSFIYNASKTLVIDSYPIIIKDNYGSSSKDVYICNNNIETKNKVKTILHKNKIPLLEEYVKGREFTCAYVKICGTNLILDPIELAYRGLIYDFETKNITSDNTLIVNPKLPKKISKKIKLTISKANKILNTQYYSRADFKINNNTVILIEINGEPVLSNDDFVARSLYKLGFEYKDLIIGLLSNSDTFLNYAKKYNKKLYTDVKNLKSKMLKTL